MKRAFLLTSLFLLVLQLSRVNSQTISIKSAKKAKDKIDNHMELVGLKLESGHYKSACSNANKAARLIQQHSTSLQKHEPNYNWKEIKELLLEVPINHCK